MTLVFTQDHRVTGKVERVHDATQKTMVIGYVLKITVKKFGKYGECGFIKCLLFLFSVVYLFIYSFIYLFIYLFIYFSFLSFCLFFVFVFFF